MAPATAGANSNITSLTGLTTELSAGQGGTGFSSYTAGDLLYASGASTLSKLNIGVDGKVLKVSSGALAWSTDTNLGNTDLTLSGTRALALDGNSLTFDGTTADIVVNNNGNLTIGGDLTISGDDLFFGTNTLGAILVADGTNFSPVVLSGDASVNASGALTINYSAAQSASAVNKGFLTSADWTTFNNKQSALGFTPLNPANNLSDLASASSARTNLGLGTLATQSGTFSGTSSGTNTGDQTTISGNAGTATSLQTARTINGTSFDGTANITVTAAAGTLTGITLASNVVNSSLTSVGTLANLTVTNPITGSITGNAATVTTNANLTGAVTSTGNATVLGSFNLAAFNAALSDADVATGGGTATGTNTGDQTISDATITLTDITTGDFSTTKHGFVPKGPNLGKFLKDDGTWATLSGGGDALVANPLSQFAITTSAQLAGVISDETGSGALVFATSPVFTTPNIGSATGSVSGNAGTATALQTARTIGGVSFDGTANITVATATGGLSVSGGDLALGASTLSGTTGIIDYTNFDIDASGNADIGGTITAGSSNIAVTLSTGMIDADVLTLIAAADGGSGTSSGSGLMARSDGIGLLQGCANGDVLRWVESTDTWDCKPMASSTETANDTTALADLPNGVGSIVEVMNSAEPSITPKTTSSRIWVTGSIALGGDGTDDETSTFRVYRDTADDTSCDGTQVDGDIVQFTTLSATDDFFISFNLIDSPATASAVFYSVCGYTSTATTPNSVTSVSITIQEIPATGADVAELYATNDESLEAGDVVSLDTNLKAGVKKSERPYGSDVIGVVSTAPAMVIGGITDGIVRAIPIALSGRVPVKVVTENGAIAAGDYLTSSSVHGTAMKSNGAGPVIGQAMTSYDGEGVGTVVAFVKNFDLGSIQEAAVLMGDISPIVNMDGSDNGLSTLIATIQSEIARDPIGIITKKITEGKQFLTDFVVARVTAIRGYFDEVFTKKIHTEQLCFKKSDGSEVCVNGDQANTLLQNGGINPVTPTPALSSPIPEQTLSSITPSETPTTTPEVIVAPVNEPVPTETPILNEATPPAEASASEITLPPPIEQPTYPASAEAQ